MSTGVVILAAGESVRMDEPKQLLVYRGQTLLRHAVDTALSLPDAPVVVVLGAHVARLRQHLDGAPVIVAENPDWREGMGGSLRTGLSALLAAHPKISAVLFLVCDQPLVSPATLGNLIATHQRSGQAIVASEYEGALGVPALFARSLFPELLALSGAGGAQKVIQAHRQQALGVPFPEGSVDIDTPADYSQLRQYSTPAPTEK